MSNDLRTLEVGQGCARPDRERKRGASFLVGQAGGGEADRKGAGRAVAAAGSR